MLWALLSCSNACAQASGSVRVVSDYRFRGVSLSDGAPALQINLAWEGADGWYAGALVSSVRLYTHADLQLQPYLGYARRLRSGLSWEMGADYAVFRRFGQDNYPEFYLGLASERLSARLYYAPRYFNEDHAVLYAELNGARALGARWRLLGHLGWLERSQRREREPGRNVERRRFDARVGLGATFDGYDLQLTRVASQGIGGDYSGYPVGAHLDEGAWVLSVARGW